MTTFLLQIHFDLANIFAVDNTFINMDWCCYSISSFKMDATKHSIHSCLIRTDQNTTPAASLIELKQVYFIDKPLLFLLIHIAPFCCSTSRHFIVIKVVI